MTTNSRFRANVAIAVCFIVFGALFASLAGCKPHHEAQHLGLWTTPGALQNVCR